MRNYISKFQDQVQGHAPISIWNKFVPIKVNILSWRIGQKRLPTRLNLDHRGIDLDSLLCPFCNEDQESELHLFGACEVASSLWEAVFQLVGAYYTADGHRKEHSLGCLLHAPPTK
ncbi:RNA-directed DNA polymerase, eukaryota, reverse transcriptase zinc-binding domain protein, partial [Tanacetum coccineum]